MAAQEALERLERSLEPDSEEDDDEVKGQREDTKHNLALSQIIVLIDTYASGGSQYGHSLYENWPPEA